LTLQSYTCHNLLSIKYYMLAQFWALLPILQAGVPGMAGST
jgi:hypothetical protein